MSAELPRYVLDSFGLLAYFGAEPGEDQVKALLRRAAAGQVATYLSAANLGEVAYIIEREQGASAARRALAAIDQLPIEDRRRRPPDGLPPRTSRRNTRSPTPMPLP